MYLAQMVSNIFSKIKTDGLLYRQHQKDYDVCPSNIVYQYRVIRL